MSTGWSLPDWARAAGAPECRGRIRAFPEDFEVQEIPLITPSNEGNHLWLEIEKRGANTDWVARQLASLAGVAGREVGYAGMKDRHGVTRQWFSIGLQEAGDVDWKGWQMADARIITACRHHRKLKRGALRGNRFRLVIRDLEGNTNDLAGRLETVKEAGVPNYFGPQRFGHGGFNVVRGSQWLKRGGRLPRNKKSIYLSSVRSFLFNELLSRRVEDRSWNRLIDGDIACLDGSHSTFPCRMPDPELDRRCAEFDIHPGGLLAGRNGVGAERDAAAVEQAALADHHALLQGLEKAGMRAARRSLRLVPRVMSWNLSGAELQLGFELPPGGYATSVLRELVTTDPDSISETT